VSFSTSYSDPNAKFLYQKIENFIPKDGKRNINIKLKGSTGISVIVDVSDFLGGDKEGKIEIALYPDIKYKKPKSIRLSNNNAYDYEEVSLLQKDYYHINFTKLIMNFYDAIIVKNTTIKFYLKELKMLDHPENKKIDGVEFNVKPGYKNISVIKPGLCGAYLGPNKTNWRQFMCQNLGGNYYHEGMKREDVVVGNRYAWGRKTPSNKEFDYSYEKGFVWKESENPCPAGFRVPTIDEWKNVLNESYNPREMLNDSKDNSIGWKIGYMLFHHGDNDYKRFIWSTTVIDDRRVYSIYVSPYHIDKNYTDNKHFGQSVRCIRKLPNDE